MYFLDRVLVKGFISDSYFYAFLAISQLIAL